MANDVVPNNPPPPPRTAKRFLRFSLRTLLLAVTFWSVLVFACTRLGLVEAVDVILGLTALLILLNHVHRELGVERRTLSALLFVLHVLATPVALIAAHIATRGNESWTWLGVVAWTGAGILMFPVAVLHHLVCRYCGWLSGMAQPGTFFLVVVLNALLWAYLWRWRQARWGQGRTEAAGHRRRELHHGRIKATAKD
jgi:hypothetical protein